MSRLLIWAMHLRCNLLHRCAYGVSFKSSSLILCKKCKVWTEIAWTDRRPDAIKKPVLGYSERRE